MCIPKDKGGLQMDDIIEFVIEFIIDIIIDGGTELTKNKKVSKWIRYPIVIIASLISLAILGLLLLVSFSIMDDTLLGGLIILGFTLLFLGIIIYKARKAYIEAKEEKEKETLLDEYKNQEGISPDLK
jgi:hypothetical protein